MIQAIFWNIMILVVSIKKYIMILLKYIES